MSRLCLGLILRDCDSGWVGPELCSYKLSVNLLQSPGHFSLLVSHIYAHACECSCLQGPEVLEAPQSWSYSQ